MWLLNRGAFEDVELSRPNDGGLLLVIDVNSKAAFIANGYLLDGYLKEDDTFNVLSKAHPHLLQGNYYKALKIVMAKLSVLLKKRSRQANRNPEKYQRTVGKPQREMGDILERIRSPREEIETDSTSPEHVTHHHHKEL